MGIMKYLAIIPAIAAVVASLYGGLQYVTGLQNTIEQNEKQITSLTMESTANFKGLDTLISSEVEKLNIRVTGVNDLYKQGREEMLLSMTKENKSN